MKSINTKTNENTLDDETRNKIGLIKCIDGIKRVIALGLPPCEAESYMAKKAAVREQWSMAHQDTGELALARNEIEDMRALAELVNMKGAGPDVILALGALDKKLNQELLGVSLSFDRTETTKITLQVAPDSPGDICVLLERNTPCQFGRRLSVPKIGGKCWVERVVLCKNGWPILMGTDPAGGGLIVASVSFSRFIPSDMMEFYGAVMPAGSEEKVMDLARRNKAPRMQRFGGIAHPTALTQRYLESMGPHLSSDDVNKLSGSYYEPDKDRMVFVSNVTSWPAGQSGNYESFLEKVADMPESSSGVLRSVCSNRALSLTEAFGAVQPSPPTAKDMLETSMILDCRRDRDVAVSMSRYSPFDMRSADMRAHELGALLAMSATLHQVHASTVTYNLPLEPEQNTKTPIALPDAGIGTRGRQGKPNAAEVDYSITQSPGKESAPPDDEPMLPGLSL